RELDRDELTRKTGGGEPGKGVAQVRVLTGHRRGAVGPRDDREGLARPLLLELMVDEEIHGDGCAVGTPKCGDHGHNELSSPPSAGCLKRDSFVTVRFCFRLSLAITRLGPPQACRVRARTMRSPWRRSPGRCVGCSTRENQIARWPAPTAP